MTYKVTLICNGVHVDPRGLSTRATVVKPISVRLLDLIVYAMSIEVLCSDIDNAYIKTNANGNIYTRVWPEFGDRPYSMPIITRDLYGLIASAEQFRTLLDNFLCSLSFSPSRYNRDMWMELNDDKDGYDYICTHVDDFKIILKYVDKKLQKISHSFFVTSHGSRSYYLINDYKYYAELDVWTYGRLTYTHETIERVHHIFGCKPKVSTPILVTDCHPELDISPLPELDDHRRFQRLLGMLQWLVTTCRPDLCHLVASLNHFGASPRENHLNLAVRKFGYLKTVKTSKYLY